MDSILARHAGVACSSVRSAMDLFIAPNIRVRMARGARAMVAVALVSVFQGASLLANTFRDSALMAGQARQLEVWVASVV